ncbi:hypothetical protein RRG08_041681 [Elysia crispata]|nr:hypothetical protein RRG08_041681 [Elysia crispata]
MLRRHSNIEVFIPHPPALFAVYETAESAVSSSSVTQSLVTYQRRGDAGHLHTLALHFIIQVSSNTGDENWLSINLERTSQVTQTGSPSIWSAHHR